MKRTLLLLVYISLVALGVFTGLKLAELRRPVDSTRMETCLQLYKNYRANQDQEKLATDLAAISLTPNDFEHIMDRFLYYRSQKSSLEQAKKLLKAFKMGFDIKVERVHSITGMESEPFRLDAEILSVFDKNPQLIKEAFES